MPPKEDPETTALKLELTNIFAKFKVMNRLIERIRLNSVITSIKCVRYIYLRAFIYKFKNKTEFSIYNFVEIYSLGSAFHCYYI